MPTYEYHCNACRSDIEIMFSSFSTAGKATPECTLCGSKKLKRLISSVPTVRRGGLPGESASPAAPGLRSETPQELAQMMKQAGAGRDLGDEFKEVAARLDKGEQPHAIEKSLRKRKGQKSGPH